MGSGDDHEGKCKLVNDPIHGYISLEPWIQQFVDTPHFQRLRDLHQLGTSYFVFPGSSHKRFEHSIGTAHLAQEMIEGIANRQKDLRISWREQILVKTAALCHDLGHGPYSHAFDSEFLPAVGIKDWCHEQGSLMMFDHIVDLYNIEMDPEECRFVRELILPSKKSAKVSFGDYLTEKDYISSAIPVLSDDVENSCSPRRQFLFDIVSNSRNSIDVDKFDYLARDCYHTGMKQFHDSQRLTRSARVIDDEICFHAKEVFNVYELFHTRYSMHKQVYTHRVSKAVEYMVLDAMIQANSVLKLSEKINDPEEYLKLTDSIINRIEFSDDPALEKSRSILKRLRHRDLYKMAAEVVIEERYFIQNGEIRPEDITSCYSANGILTPEDIIVQRFKINYGKNNQNPVDFVHFYDHTESIKFDIPADKVSFIIPRQFSETYLRIFCRDPSPEKLQAASQALRIYLKKQISVPFSPAPALHKYTRV